MPFSIASYAIWAAGTLALAVCLVLLFRHRRHRRLPAFTVYIAAVFLADLLAWWVYHRLPRGSVEAYYTHWAVEAVLLVLRGLVIAEICRRVLEPYRGVWGVARLVLAGVAGVLVLVAALVAWGQSPVLVPLVLTARRGLELAAVSVLTALALLCRVYDVPIRRVEGMIALGLGTYSAIEVVNSTLAREWILGFFPAWSVISTGSFLLALGIWLVALLRPAEAAEPVPARLPVETYAELSPVVNRRLRELNTRLEEMLRR
jgi:hypothetical protein